MAQTQDTATHLRARKIGGVQAGWNIYDRSKTLLGWVVRIDGSWRAYVVRRWDGDGRRVGWDFRSRDDAVTEVWIQAETRQQDV